MIRNAQSLQEWVRAKSFRIREEIFEIEQSRERGKCILDSVLSGGWSKADFQGGPQIRQSKTLVHGPDHRNLLIG